MERVLTQILQRPFPVIFPFEGTLDKHLLLTFLLARKSEGATRAMILMELKLWENVLTDIGGAVMPKAWLTRQTDTLFHKGSDPKSQPKEAMAHTTVDIILT